MDKDQAIRKAQKLMAVAMDGRGNDNEAERALAQAETLIRKFGIEQAEIASTKAAVDFDWADAFHAYGPPNNPAKSCPRWFQFVSTGVAYFTDTIVRLHYDPTHGYGVGFYGDRADTLFAQWLVGYLKAKVWDALNVAHRQHPEWNRSDMEDFRKAMAARLSSRMRDLRQERDALTEQYNNGSLAQNDYKVLMAKNAFLEAQLIEENQQKIDQNKEQVFERRRDLFND